MEDLDWDKGAGLLPAVVQDARNGAVLMLGYMNKEALAETRSKRLVTFYSRSKGRLWQKGETSGHTLAVVSVAQDCDRDTLLIRAIPAGPVCHLGSATCFGSDPGPELKFLRDLEQTVQERKLQPKESSYTAKLFRRGRDKIAQKVGEEAVEVVIASKNDSDAEFLGECADLMYHLTVLLADRELSWAQVVNTLKDRKT